MDMDCGHVAELPLVDLELEAVAMFHLIRKWSDGNLAAKAQDIAATAPLLHILLSDSSTHALTMPKRQKPSRLALEWTPYS